MKTNCSSSWGFTLIELLVVLTLLSILAGMTFVRLDGVSDDARLRACAATHASVIKLAQVQARSSGEPRLVEYTIASLLLRKPNKRSGSWEWDEGISFDLTPGVRLSEILTQSEGSTTKQAIRVNANGRLADHAVFYQVHDRYLVALFSNFHEPRYGIFPRRPEASSWSNLVKLIAQSNEKP